MNKKSKFTRVLGFVLSLIAMLAGIASTLYMSNVVGHSYDNKIILVAAYFAASLFSGWTLASYVAHVLQPTKTTNEEGKFIIILNILVILSAVIDLCWYKVDSVAAWLTVGIVTVSIIFGIRYIKWLNQLVKYEEEVTARADRQDLQIDQLRKDLGNANGSAQTYQRQFDEEVRSHQGCKANLHAKTEQYNKLKQQYDELLTKHDALKCSVTESPEYKKLAEDKHKLELHADEQAKELEQFKLQMKATKEYYKAYRAANKERINANARKAYAKRKANKQ